MTDATPDSETRRGWRERLLRRAIGVRRGFGGGDRVVLVAAAAEPRSAVAWTIPVFGALIGLLLLVGLWFIYEPDTGAGFPAMMYRVFVLDYVLFVWGLLSGVNMARRWRSNSDQVEEISLTPLLPSVVATMITAGPCTVWLAAIGMFSLFEMLAPMLVVADLQEVVGRAEPGFRVLLITVSLVSAVAMPLAFAWFHYESVRLAHWIMVVHALPKISLWQAGFVGFLQMMLIVVALSAVGSMVTAFLYFLVIFPALAVEASSTQLDMGDIMGSYAVVGLVSIPGALLVAWLKRHLASTFERRFTQAWLLYQWWGAGERRQPTTYPLAFRRQLPLWEAWTAAEEEAMADVAPERRFQRRRLEGLILSRQRAAWRAQQARNMAAQPGSPPPTSGSSSGSPSQSPGPRIGP